MCLESQSCQEVEDFEKNKSIVTGETWGFCTRLRDQSCYSSWADPSHCVFQEVLSVFLFPVFPPSSLLTVVDNRSSMWVVQLFPVIKYYWRDSLSSNHCCSTAWRKCWSRGHFSSSSRALVFRLRRKLCQDGHYVSSTKLVEQACVRPCPGRCWEESDEQDLYFFCLRAISTTQWKSAFWNITSFITPLLSQIILSIIFGSLKTNQVRNDLGCAI